MFFGGLRTLGKVDWLLRMAGAKKAKRGIPSHVTAVSLLELRWWVDAIFTFYIERNRNVFTALFCDRNL